MRSKSLFEVHKDLAASIGKLHFGPPVAYVYNPLEYASEPLREYLERYGRNGREILLLGMNPGPFGMAQTGVPFGDPKMVMDWLGIRAHVGHPPQEHPKRAIQGFESKRREVSGQRLWGWARDRFGSPADFFARFLVLNYCPLVFMEESGRNRTPDKLRSSERDALFEACDRALRELVEIVRPKVIAGIGAFAEARARAALEDDCEARIGRVLHPSPASPAANGGWVQAAEEDLRDLGVELPPREPK